MTAYVPKPIDTSGVSLDRDQHHLVERLAENVHDVWARRRMANGWQAGTKLDNEALTHPYLVPYAELPESEKAFDREMVEQVIKAALLLGYSVTRTGA